MKSDGKKANSEGGRLTMTSALSDSFRSTFCVDATKIPDQNLETDAEVILCIMDVRNARTHDHTRFSLCCKAWTEVFLSGN